MSGEVDERLLALAHRTGARRGGRDDDRGSCSAACWARRGCRARSARRPRVPRRRRGLTPTPPDGMSNSGASLYTGLRPRAAGLGARRAVLPGEVGARVLGPQVSAPPPHPASSPLGPPSPLRKPLVELVA
ncbi:hypothetical protein PAHAL_2G035500 [Panicum hallii]|uniref:Uncharacterized protein n=1 Tax=Panicum hallii TaxID=206008 RepID=A0A2T8KMQ3_9POAL|nr:hypothetical protein PAHAL_2G035500 [Panicum hallii]